MKALKHVKLITETGIEEGQSVVFDSTVKEITPEDQTNPGVEVIDGGGYYLAPGFIDLHIHGCAGYDTMDQEPEALEVIAANVVKTGVTAFLPTTMTMETSRIVKALERIRIHSTAAGQARILGCHLEGPFLCQKFKGAQDGRYIINPDFTLIEPFSDIVRMITIAPENPGSTEFIQACRDRGIVVSIGHSSANYDQAVAAIAAGASHITHTFNAMNPLHHREPGIIAAAMLTDVTCQLIVDNIHIHPAIQKVLLKTKGIDGIILITDAMRACLLQEGQYDLGGQQVQVHNGEARLADGTLAGSVLTLNRAVKNFTRNTGLPLWETVKLATLNPARELGLNSKGRIAPGQDSDFVLFDEEFNVIMTFVAGQLAYRNE